MNKKIIVKVENPDYYRFIKKLQNTNINTLKIEYIDKNIYLTIYEKDYEKLKKYLISYKFKKVKNLGIYSFNDKIKANYPFLFSLIIGIILYIALTNTIFEVNIVHEDKNIRDILEEELDNYDLKVLHFKKSYQELKRIKEQILDRHPDTIDWLEFETDGNILNVRVEKRVITDITKETKYCNLVATKSGIINDILIYDGETNVMINDYVRKGDILVKGTIKLNEEEKRYTCASGKVYATTWYTASVKIPFTHTEYIKTGKKRYNFVYEIDGNKKEVLKSLLPNKKVSYKTILQILNFNLYLSTEEEVVKVSKTYTEEEALEEGINKAVENILLTLGEFDTIIDKKVLKKSVNDSTMDIDVFIVVKELISTEERFTIDLAGKG